MFLDLEEGVVEAFETAQVVPIALYSREEFLGLRFFRSMVAALGGAEAEWTKAYNEKRRQSKWKKVYDRAYAAKRVLGSQSALMQKYVEEGYFRRKHNEYTANAIEKRLKEGWRPKRWSATAKKIAEGLGIEVLDKKGCRRRGDIEERKRQLLAGERPKRRCGVWLQAAKELGIEI